MSEEETIKRIEESLKLTELCQRTTNAPKISANYIWDMRTLLDLYNKEKEKNEGLNATLTLVNIGLENYISKDKIREKIKEYQNKLDNTSFVLDSEYYGITSKIQVLKELLEEE